MDLYVHESKKDESREPHNSICLCGSGLPSTILFEPATKVFDLSFSNPHQSCQLTTKKYDNRAFFVLRRPPYISKTSPESPKKIENPTKTRSRSISSTASNQPPRRTSPPLSLCAARLLFCTDTSQHIACLQALIATRTSRTPPRSVKHQSLAAYSTKLPDIFFLTRALFAPSAASLLSSLGALKIRNSS